MARPGRESINFKLPQELVAALRTAAVERETTATDLVIQGLHYILQIEDTTEVRLSQLEEGLDDLTNCIESTVEASTESHAERLSNVEDKLETVFGKLHSLESALIQIQQSSLTPRRRRNERISQPVLFSTTKARPISGRKLSPHISNQHCNNTQQS
ncbi:MAG: hypothetical protein AAF316_17190 [Cyanobacteria bacterium P01_A01_bin.80]